jgi:hypothetical protein
VRIKANLGVHEDRDHFVVEFKVVELGLHLIELISE